jgi:predicted adenylyl cyclase CyaB
MQNVEIKARVADPAGVAGRARALGFAHAETLEQEDVYFAVPHGRLKLRLVPGRRAELIRYERPDASAPRPSVYEIVDVEDGRGLAALLARALGVRGRVRKRRQLFLRRNVRLHLDDVDGAGCFLELEAVLERDDQREAAVAEVTDLLAQLGIGAGALASGSYIDLAADPGNAIQRFGSTKFSRFVRATRSWVTGLSCRRNV